MAAIRDGNKAALLVVDVQVGVVKQDWDTARIIKNINVAVDKAHKEGVPVIWVQHVNEELVQDSPDWQLAPDLQPAEGDFHIYKHYNSSFEQTELEDTLATHGVNHIVLAGAETNWCIRATAYAALERGYDLTLVRDAHTTGTIELADGSKIMAADIVRDLNIVMNWVSYPGRANRSMAAEELDFVIPGGGK